ncbi:MAG: pilus assembly protein TadG-related protein [Acidimicrobiales bacterium]
MRFSGSTDERTKGEQGFVLAMTALMIVPLIIFTAFAVDLGAWYGQAAKMQRAADAASLAGVVQLPNKVNAVAAAQATLAKNGFAYTCVTAPATGPCVVSYPSGADQQMNVALQTSASQYFSKIVLKSETLNRDATAVYNLKIPLGSPSNVFGNDPTRTGPQPNLWAAINGPYSNHADGDPYSPKCAVGPSSATACNSSGANPTYRSSGYMWAVDVPASAVGSPITVSIYDPSFGPNGTLSESTTNAGFATSYQIFNTTGSAAALNLNNSNGMNTLGRCSTGPGYKVFLAGDTTGQNAWWTLCTFTPTIAGIYPVQVKTSAIPTVTPDSGGGWNAYALKATKASGTQPQTYAIDDLSIWTPTPSSNARFYLANIGAQYAGHTLQLDLYDPGDGNSGNYFMTFHPPPAGVPAIVPTATATTACTYSPPTANIGGATTLSSSTCTIQTRNASASPANIYNNNWLRVNILIPTTYTCTTDCWWSIEYNFGTGSPTDRTVWVVNVLGDPVHLTQ